MNEKLKLYRRLLVEVEQLQVAVREQGLSKIGGHEVRLKEITQALGLPPVVEFRAATDETWDLALEEKMLTAKSIQSKRRLEGERKAGTGWGGFLFGSPHDLAKREFITDPTIDAWRPIGVTSSEFIKLRYTPPGFEEHLERERDKEKQRASVVLRKWCDAAKLGIRHAKIEDDDEPLPEKPVVVKKKQSTQPNEACEKLKAALCSYHGFDGVSCTNYEPIGSNELCRLAEVKGKASGSRFFKSQFGGLKKYEAACGNNTNLIFRLRLLRGEVKPRDVPSYGDVPPGKGRDDE